MDLNKFLTENPIITKAELARLMWPDKKATNIKLANKLANRNGQRITPDDQKLAINVLTLLTDNIEDLKKQP